jgi:hypothetical protein
MSAEGLITLEQVVQDGTKIKAQAARDASGNSGWSRDWKSCRNYAPASRGRG